MPLYGEAKRKYQREWMASRRLDWIESKGGRCALCGSADRLEVDHIDPSTKLMQPREIWSRAERIRDAELAKCQVLCGICHLDKTLAEGSLAVRAVQHGGGSTGKRGCQCEPCKTKRNSYDRQRRASKKMRAVTQ